MTSQRERLAYARICIEVNKDSTFPTSIEIKDHDGTIFSQQVEYEWVPTMCECCKQLGHKQNQCKRNTRKEWRPVVKTSDNTTPIEGNEHNQAESKNNSAPDFNVKDNSLKQPQSSSKAIVISNKFNPLDSNEQEEALSITPIAVDTSLILKDCSPPMPSNAGKQGKEVIVATQPNHEEEPPPSPNIPASSNEGSAKLSKTQRKKKEKIQHAIDAKNKAVKAKSPNSTPSPK